MLPLIWRLALQFQAYLKI